MSGYLSDSNGDKSSKRLVGSILVAIGTTMAVAAFIFALLRPESDYAASIDIFEILIGWGCALLGIGVAEGLFKPRDKR